MDDRAEAKRRGWRLSLVIPAYNEADGIAAAVAEADDALAAQTSDYEVLIVDDGSRDGTAQVVAETARDRPHVRLLCHPENRGYGAALRTGFEAARFEHVAFTDADCQFYLDDLALLLPLTDRFPVVAGRHVNRQDPWRRRFFSWGYNRLARALLGTRVTDCDCALKVFRREALAHLLPESRGFFVNSEMLTRARQAGLDVAEVPVRHRPRRRGESKVSFADIPRTLRTLLSFWWTRVLFPRESRVQSPESRACPGDPSLCKNGEVVTRGAKQSFAAVPSQAELGTEEYESRSQAPLGNAPPRSSASHPVQRLHPSCQDPVHRNRLGTLDSGLWTILLVAALLFFGHFRCPLQEPQESRYAEIPRQMLAEGRWVVPVLHGQPYLDKPPLFYWLVMASYRVFGIEDWAARLVPCLTGFLCVIVTYCWGRRVAGARAALMGALALCLSARFLQFGRMLVMDGPLSLAVVAGWAAAHLALHEGRMRRGWWLLSATAVGLGVLTKGPVALVLVAVPVALYQLLDQRAARARWRSWAAYLAIVAAVAAPWYVLIALRDPQFARYFFWDHNVRRFVDPFDHAKAGWFYLPTIILGMFPWTLLLPGLAAFVASRSTERESRRPAALGFFLLAFAWCLGFFSLAGCKRPYYIVPAMPPLALALGCYLDAELPRAWRLLFQRRAVAWMCVTAGTFALLFVGIHEMLPGYARRFSLRGQVRRLNDDVRTAGMPVLCYPHRWDSVSFYLRRNDVEAYPPECTDELIGTLRRQPETLVFVKSGKWLDDFRRCLPPSLEFVPERRQGFVSVGRVRHRTAICSP